MAHVNGGLNGSLTGGSGVTSIKNEKRASWNDVSKRLVVRSVGQAGTEVGIGYWIGQSKLPKSKYVGKRVADVICATLTKE